MAKAIRYSKKREALLQVIQQTDCHPTAEWLYQTLKPQHPDLSLGTVYRNLLFFQEQGLVKSVGVVNGQERFDGRTEAHAHFVCSHCGCVSDLHGLKLAEDLAQTVCQQYQVTVARHELTFYGTCQSCIQK